MKTRLAVPLVVAVMAALLGAPAPPAPAAVGVTDEVGLFDPTSGRWHLRYPDGRLSSFYFGVPSDTPLLGDWDCDGIDTVALYRESTGFIYLRNSNTFGVGEVDFFFGNPGDIPIAGDWDGDGCDSFGIFRGGRFFLSNQLETTFADLDFYLGAPGDQPVAGDFNGDGKDTVAVHRPAANTTYVTEDLSGLPDSGGVATVDAEYWFGGPGAMVVAGDWDADGDDTLGVFKTSPTSFVLANDNNQLEGDDFYLFGEDNWLPVIGNLGPPPPLPALALESVASGFDRPLFVTAPDGDDRLFVVEQRGRIKIVDKGVVSSQPFLDLSGVVSQTGNERGLLGMAFHPNYWNNGVFYVHYNNTAGDTRVVEYRRPRDVGLSGPDSVTTVLSVTQPFSNHNGGMIQFGPDGRLYVGLGDGGSGGDPHGNGQNPNTRLGSVLAIDVDGAGRYQIWATGLRNPWRFDFDGDLIYIGDVGQNDWEEVSVGSSLGSKETRNFGWNVQEGFACYPDGTTGCDTTGLVQPVVAYPNPAEGCSVTGGYVYRGWRVEGLNGAYLYSDYCNSFLRGFVYDGAEIVESRQWNLGITGLVSSFGEDGRGELYITTFDGRVSKIVAAG